MNIAYETIENRKLNFLSYGDNQAKGMKFYILINYYLMLNYILIYMTTSFY
jgi:hypothetical protein